MGNIETSIFTVFQSIMMHFDENMNYIPNKEKYDPWYESVKDEVRKKEMLKHKKK